MSVLRPRQRAPQRRRAELLDAAERLFLEQGMAATRIEAITAAAQVAKGTFYLYFPSKDALVAAVQARFVERFCLHMDALLAALPADDWNGRLRAWCEGAVARYLDQVALHDVIFANLRTSTRPLMRENPFVLQLTRLLADGQAAGVWRRVDAGSHALMMFYAMHGLADDAIVRGGMDDGVDGAAVADTLYTCFGRALTLP